MTTPSKSLRVTLVAVALAVPGALAAQHADHAAHAGAPPAIPASLREEHQEIHARLEASTRAPGATGRAARELAAVLHPHFVREEQIALPPLGLLAPLAQGRYTPEMRSVLAMTDSLRAELPRMLQEHVAIHAATARLADAARAEGHAEAAELAATLALHAKGEEEIFYPAAVLVGDLVRAHP
jgi:hypothetical protein